MIWIDKEKGKNNVYRISISEGSETKDKKDFVGHIFFVAGKWYANPLNSKEQKILCTDLCDARDTCVKRARLNVQ